jgi:hypothetical protein
MPLVVLRSSSEWERRWSAACDALRRRKDRAVVITMAYLIFSLFPNLFPLSSGVAALQTPAIASCLLRLHFGKDMKASWGCSKD